MSLASTVQRSAAKALKSYGAPGTLTRVVPGAYDPVTGGSTQSTTSIPVSALLDASSLQGLGFKFGPDLVQGGDLKATLSAEAVAGDSLTVAGGTFQVIAVRPSYVGATAVLWEALVRR